MEEFIGFEKIISTFKRRAENNTLSHAHLIVGADGIGKSILAKIFALNILGRKDDRDYVDIINYRLKKASFGVDDVRDIIHEIEKKPYEADKKVIIVHDAHKMTVQGQNAFLKSIEEPPKGVYIIILTESLEFILDTIKSRAQIYKLTALSEDDMQRYLRKIGKQNDEKAIVALSYGEGIPGRANRIFLDNKLIEIRNDIIDMLNGVSVRDTKILKLEDKFSKFKGDKEEIINLIALFIRDITIYKELNDRKRIINIDKYEDIKKLASEMAYKKLESMLNIINIARENIRNNISYSIAISIMLIRFVEE